MCGLGPVAWQAESDEYALSILARHWPAATRYSDVREVDERATRVDVVCGGFPCQPHSSAGARRGTADSRWLWPEFARVIGAIRPAAVFIENVPPLRFTGLRDVLADLAGLGFDAEWDCFSAAQAGAPHRRRRLFILAHAHGERGDAWRAQLRCEGTAGRPVAGGALPPWVVADANREGELEPGGSVGQQWRWARDGGRWFAQSPFPGVDDGTANRLDRERLCGNACVPQQAALAFRTLVARATAGARDVAA